MRDSSRVLLITLIVLSVLSLSFPGCVRVKAPDASATLLSDAALATSVDSLNRPVSPSNTFRVTDDLIYLSVKLNGAPAGTQVMARMSYTGGGDAGAPGNLFNGSLAGQGTTYLAFAMKSPPGGYPQGNYSVSISVNGKEMTSIPFTVQNLQSQQGWPVVSKFTASPDRVSQGQPVTLSWEISGATRISLQPEVGTVQALGTRSITPLTTTTYKLIAANDAGATTREVTVVVVAAVSGAPDLIITDLSLLECMVYYRIKNIGSQPALATTTYITVDGLQPPLGFSSFADVLRPGEERGLQFSSFKWPWCGSLPGAAGAGGGGGGGSGCGCSVAYIGGAPYSDFTIMNHVVKVCADAKNDISEASKSNNCLTHIFGQLFFYDLTPLSHMATWRNSVGEVPQFGNEGSPLGGYIKSGDGSVEMFPPLNNNSWIQGYYGYFYTKGADFSWGADRGPTESPIMAIKIPPQVKFVGRVGLASHATGSDGVVFKLGLRTLDDVTNMIASKAMKIPGVYEDWVVDLSDYEGQVAYIVLRVEAAGSADNDFAVWKTGQLVQSP